MASQIVLVVKNPPANAGDPRVAGSIPGLGRSPGEGNGNPVQFSCLENSMDRSLVDYSPWGHKESDITEQLKSESEVVQSGLTLCDLIDCSLLGSSVHGVFQARILEWVAISSSRGSFRSRDRTHIFWVGRLVLYH